MGIEQQFKPILNEMLIERVVGTTNHEFIKTVNCIQFKIINIQFNYMKPS